MTGGRPDFATALPLMVAQAEMRHRERLVWAERAVRGSGFRAAVGSVLVGLAFAGFAAFWMVAAWGITRAGGETVDLIGWLFPLFGLPFLAVGLGLAASPLLSMGRPRPIYAVSSQRVLVIEGWRGDKVRAFDLMSIGDLSRTERPDGSGDITFGGVPAAQSLATLGHGLAGKRAGLSGVPDVRRFADEIERMRRLAVEEAQRLRAHGSV